MKFNSFIVQWVNYRKVFCQDHFGRQNLFFFLNKHHPVTYAGFFDSGDGFRCIPCVLVGQDPTEGTFGYAEKFTQLIVLKIRAAIL